MAKALDDDEFIFQLQLEEIRKVSNQTGETDVPCDLFHEVIPPERSSQVPRFCDTLRNGGRRNNYPIKFDENTALTDIPRERSEFHECLVDDMERYVNNGQLTMSDSISVQLDPYSPESQGSLSEMNGAGSMNERFLIGKRKVQIPSPIQYPNENPHCDLTKFDSMIREQFNFVTDNGTDSLKRNMDEDLNLRDSHFDIKLKSNIDSKPNVDKLIAKQMQLEEDKDTCNAKDINNLEERDRILAERMQLESDLESAKELQKHNSRRKNSVIINSKNGLFNLGNIKNIRLKNVDLPQYWSNSSPLEMQRETESPNSHQIQHTPDHVQSERFHRNFIGLLNGTRYRGRPTPVQISNTLVATRPATPDQTATDAVQQFRRRPQVDRLRIGAQEMQGRPDYHLPILQHHLLTNYGRRSFRRLGSNFPADDIDVDGLEYDELLELEEQMGEVKIRGLQQSEIETLPKETIKDLKQIEETQCAICFENFQLEDGIRKLSCSHVYHVNCIDKWLKVKAECPICKENVKGYQ